MKSTLNPPRWKGGPDICISENLPAFETVQQMQAFNAANAPSCKVVRFWRCEVCDHYHEETKAPDPTGGSSGTGRGSKGKE